MSRPSSLQTPLLVSGAPAPAVHFASEPLPACVGACVEAAGCARLKCLRSPLAWTPELSVSAAIVEKGTSLDQPDSALSIAGSPLPCWKRAIDLACCTVALPWLALCALVMTLVTRCVSPGPVFFRQERVGHRGRRFKIYKFRTMKIGADTSVHQSYLKDLIGTNAPMVKLDARGDARLIPGAWLLRASGLDELPQLINVLRGEMSIVGPRPCIPGEFAQYLPWQRQRCDALPGLTGLWQVSGKNRTTFEQMIRYDIQYAHHLSCWLDLKIIFLTVPSLLVQIHDTRQARKSLASSGEQAASLSPLAAPAHNQSP